MAFMDPQTAASIAAPMSWGGSPGMNFNNPAKSYNSSYQRANDLNQQLYKNTLAGYQQQISQYQQNQQQLAGGYGQLQANVMRRLRGTNQANINDINKRYTAMSGQMSQQMIDRGLGNTTVQQSVQRGVASDRAAEATRSQNQFAQLQSQYATQLGGMRLGAMGAGYNNLAALQGGELNYLNSVSAPYPDPGMYAQLAMHLASGRVGMGGLPGMPGPSPGMGQIGGPGPRSDAFGGGGSAFGPDYFMGGGGYGAMGLPGGFGGGYGPADMGSISGYGKSYGGDMNPSYATSGQYGGTGYGGAYAGLGAMGYGGAQSTPDYSGAYSSYDPLQWGG